MKTAFTKTKQEYSSLGWCRIRRLDRMKIILSRKGFDSGSGGYASFILPGDILQSLPIPSSSDSIAYSEVHSRFQNKNLMELMQSIKPEIKEQKWKKLESGTKCHLDPDLDALSFRRLPGWKGCFGQVGAAQTVLANAGIGIGDVFIFFGWFHECELQQNNSLKMKKGEGKHVIFGYLQIGEMIYPCAEAVPDWLKYHPHSSGDRVAKNNNCIYIARDFCSWDKNIPGYGILKYHPQLDLSMPEMSRSKWKLPDIFREVSITYHTKSSWKDGYFQSAARGQEFVVEENDSVTAWAQNLITNNYTG